MNTTQPTDTMIDEALSKAPKFWREVRDARSHMGKCLSAALAHLPAPEPVVGVKALTIELRDKHGKSVGTPYEEGQWDMAQRIIAALTTSEPKPRGPTLFETDVANTEAAALAIQDIIGEPNQKPGNVEGNGAVADKPFMYGIMEPDGTAYMDEICVDLSPGTLEELIEENEMEGHTVVALYLHPGNESAWQPIETAPKDGTLILLSRKHSMVVGYWNDEWETWKFHIDGLFNSATHWQPLPAAPQHTGEGKADE